MFKELECYSPKRASSVYREKLLCHVISHLFYQLSGMFIKLSACLCTKHLCPVMLLWWSLLFEEYNFSLFPNIFVWLIRYVTLFFLTPKTFRKK